MLKKVIDSQTKKGARTTALMVGLGNLERRKVALTPSYVQANYQTEHTWTATFSSRS